MNKEEVQSISFQLIGYAGDAFSNFFQAVEMARKGEIDEANRLMKEGKTQLAKAHQAQTQLLATEAGGEDIAYSVILVHAQDHLMTAIMYERIAKEFIELYKERKERRE